MTMPALFLTASVALAGLVGGIGAGALEVHASVGDEQSEFEERWSAHPSGPGDYWARDAERTCLDEDPHAPAQRQAAIDGGEVLFDRRGDAGAFVQWILPSYTYNCFVFWDPGWDDLTWGAIGFGPGLDDLQDVADLAVAVVSQASYWGRTVYGLAGPGVARVVLETAGGDIEATVAHGRFAAWWPREDPPVALRAYDVAGALVLWEGAEAGVFPNRIRSMATDDCVECVDGWDGR